MDGNKWKIYHNLNKKAQSLLELAVFGTIILLLLGVLINYGLSFNYQQKIMQQTFRKALVSANEANQGDKPISTSHLAIKDVHFPDPQNAFGIGSPSQVLANASVSRDYRLSDLPSNAQELPVVYIDINGVQKKYTTAGLWPVPGISEDVVEKYLHIYGVGNVQESARRCVKYAEPESDPEYINEPVCEEYEVDLTIVDPALGEIFDYDSAVSRCRKFIDEDVCIDECNKDSWLSDSTDTECVDKCSPQIQAPWYCQTLETPPTSDHKYTFVALDRIFKVTGTIRRELGLQPDYAQNIISDSVLNKQEDATGITTTENLNWQVDTTRTIITSKGEAGQLEPVGGEINKEEVPTSVFKAYKDKTQRTDW